jgi:hypothetical protein
MYCKACGEQLPEDAAFCSECGVPQDSYDQQPRESHEEWVARLGSQTFEATAPLEDRPAWKALLAPLRLLHWEYQQLARAMHPRKRRD